MKLSLYPLEISDENGWELHHSPLILGSRDDLASLGTIDTELVGTPQVHVREEAWVGPLDILISQAARTGNASILDLSSSSTCDDT